MVGPRRGCPRDRCRLGRLGEDERRWKRRGGGDAKIKSERGKFNEEVAWLVYGA